MTLKLILLPLDERPVNTRCPQMLGAIGGAEVILPPTSVRGHLRTPADRDAVAAWLEQAVSGAQAALVSAEYLGSGNLINSRISSESVTGILARLALLPKINARCPVHAFSVITRVPHADDCVEEPLYWCEWGTRFARYARLTHQEEQQGPLTGEMQTELQHLEMMLPLAEKSDWLTRRLRNHTVNLALLEMTVRGDISSLLLTSDDTSLLGFPSRERDWLLGWHRLLGSAVQDRVQMHPGADEVGSVLVARQINDQAQKTPQVWLEWAVPGDEELVAPYEDRPVRETVWGQLSACGCTAAPSAQEADFILGVATPSPHLSDYHLEYLEEDRLTRTADYVQFLIKLAEWQQQGHPIALADVAYPNGSDPLLTELLLSPECPLDPDQLCAYGGWNTAGNTLGVVAAQAVCALLMNNRKERQQAQSLFLTHRFLEDWAYQSHIRRAARDHAETLWGRRDPDPNTPQQINELCRFIADRLEEKLEHLQQRKIGLGVHIVPGSVRLPWSRTFEVDFRLEA